MSDRDLNFKPAAAAIDKAAAFLARRRSGLILAVRPFVRPSESLSRRRRRKRLGFRLGFGAGLSLSPSSGAQFKFAAREACEDKSLAANEEYEEAPPRPFARLAAAAAAKGRRTQAVSSAAAR